jgi:hypothetical protein
VGSFPHIFFAGVGVLIALAWNVFPLLQVEQNIEKRREGRGARRAARREKAENEKPEREEIVEVS